ncbi:MAG: enoyl-CoA hydratase/isomerase family protein [Thermogemmata sp.]|nr:enoyl-CoA hydratase/isomerase family protein [Thermogemmata sp.]
MVVIYRSRYIQVVVEQGIARLTFAFPDRLHHCWDGIALQEWEAVVDWLIRSPGLGTVVIASGRPAGFCGGLSPTVWRDYRCPAERAAWAWKVQHLVRRLTECPAITIACLKGACQGVGLELALACDYRLAVQQGSTCLGFPQGLMCFGGSALLRSRYPAALHQQLATGTLLSALEAYQGQLVDRVCVPEQEEQALRSLLQDLPRLTDRRTTPVCWLGLAEERRRFATWPPPEADIGCQELAQYEDEPDGPTTIGICGEIPQLQEWFSQILLAGTRLLVYGPMEQLHRHLQQLEARGFFPPQHKEELLQRLQPVDSVEALTLAEAVFVDAPQRSWELLEKGIGSGPVVWVQPPGGTPLDTIPQAHRHVPRAGSLVRLSVIQPHRLALIPDRETDQATLRRLQLWFQRTHRAVTIFPPAVRLLAAAA